MTGQVGTLSLGAGVAASVAATLLWLRLALTAGTPPAPRLARLATGTTLLAAALACGALEWALLRHDFSVRFVAENGGRHVPLYYTVTSLWSALDGSLLLWLLILAGYATLLCRAASAGDRRLHHYAMSLVSTVTIFFFALAYFAANPFQPVQPVPADGPGPNPLLQQHPAMGLHPPLLYAGYIGLVVPFAYALAGLLAGRTGGQWLAAARNWTLPAWALLTAGITLGAWWSYAVLGWGGYWAWDPVENASLLPWLTATAFLHAVMSRRAREQTGWPVGLACASFLLVLVGTFLTRSGVVASVHAFTESALGPMLLGFILLATVGTVVLVGWRSRPEVPQPATGQLLSRSTALLGNRILLTTLASVVLLGTVFPLIAQAATGSRTAVGPAYFNRTASPLAVALLALMGLASLLRHGAHRPAELAHRSTVPAGVGLATVAVTGLLSRPGPMALAAFGCAAFALAGTTGALLRELRGGSSGTRTPEPAGVWVRRLVARLRHRRRMLAGALAHAGIALVAVGAAASSAYTVSTERELTVGQSIRVDGASARLAAIDRAADGSGMRVRAQLVLASGNRPVGPAVPALVYYPQRDVTISVPAIRAGLVRDTYTTLIAVSADGGSATVRLAVNPMVSMIWAGGALTALGGLLAIGGRRRGSRTTAAPTPELRANTPQPVPAAVRTAEGAP
jgi:cytochrome c-type biogenesis protein CcmF